MARLDSVNGLPPAEAAGRPEFAELTPTYPSERLRLEGSDLTGRVVDLSPDELRAAARLRRVLLALDAQEAVELLLGRLRETSSNAEFIAQVTRP